jgi:hypothetical protein
MGEIPSLAGKLKWDAAVSFASALSHCTQTFARFLALTRQHSWLIVGFISIRLNCKHMHPPSLDNARSPRTVPPQLLALNRIAIPARQFRYSPKRLSGAIRKSQGPY